MKSSASPLRLSGTQRIAAHALLLALCVPFILPLVWMTSTSLKTDDQIYAREGRDTAISLTSLIPSPVKWSNYAEAVQTVPVGAYLRNTIFLCAANVAGAVLASAIVAYGFARLRFRGREVLFMLMISTMALPGQVTMIPVFALFRALGWYGTFLPLIVPACFGNPFYIFLMRQFFRTIPEELAEAARIDGASEWRIFWQVMLPLAKPAMATCALFQFLYTWNDFFGPLLYINDPTKYTLAYGLQQFMSSYGGEWAQLMAGACIFTVPVIVLFFLAQRTFIQGIATTGGKA
ncbi:MAG TPA: carbohydrate ABC transporter permease [Candidatus Hydrogenedentes bacterium]|nr:carbohydrate ABC transporter permease [Candidatus Hydrogenedentota bacterium]